MKQCTEKNWMWSWCFTKVVFLTFPSAFGCVAVLGVCAACMSGDWTQSAARETERRPALCMSAGESFYIEILGLLFSFLSVCSGPQGSSWTHQTLWVPERGWSGQRDGVFDWSSWEGGVNRQRCTSFLMTEEQSWTRASVRSGWSQEHVQNEWNPELRSAPSGS